MTTSSRHRTTSRLGRWSGLLLVAATLPLVGPAAPAFAAECTSEARPTSGPPLNIPTGPGCDDPEPPETTIGSVSPQPNGQDWIDEKQVSFTFSGAHNDADTDPISFECQFFNTATPPEEWTACTSPASYDELEETPTTPYTFRVRAIDTADHNIDLTADPLFPQDTDQPDFDQTPAERTVKVDTVDPIASTFLGPYDEEGTGWPIVMKPQVTYLLSASEDDVSYDCQLDGKDVGCNEGRTTFKGLSGGNRTLSVTVTDPAGNVDRSPATEQFVVPYNLTKGKNWTKQRARGFFAGDVLQTRKAGARIKFRAQNIREFRVVAPAGPKLGKIRVRTGTGFWKTYDLSKGKTATSRYIVVRDAASPLFSGQILVESLSRGKQVRVDALVFPPS